MAFFATVSASGGRVTPTLSRRAVSPPFCPPFWGADAGPSKSSKGCQSSPRASALGDTDSQPEEPRDASKGAKEGREVGGVSRELHNIRHAQVRRCLLFTHRRGAPIFVVRGHCQTCPFCPGVLPTPDRGFQKAAPAKAWLSSFRAYNLPPRTRSQEICGVAPFSWAWQSSPRASRRNARSSSETPAPAP